MQFLVLQYASFLCIRAGGIMESHHLLFELLFRHSYGFDKLGFQHLLFREFCEVLRHMDAGFAEFQQFNQAVALFRAKQDANRRVLIRTFFVFVQPAQVHRR